MGPTLSGFVTFIAQVMGITTQQLPSDSPVIPLAYNVAIQTVNILLGACPTPGADPTLPSLYALAVYNLAGDRLLNWAQDPTNAPIYKDGLPFFAYIRKTLNLTGFVPGVIQSTNDLTTGGSYVVPDAFQNMTIGDLQNLKTTYGRTYLALAQDYGPSDWGLS